MKEATSFATGPSYILQYREGPWAHKKAFQTLLDRMPGFHLNWASVTEKPQFQRKESQKWSVPDEVLDAGAEFVNKNCPEENDQNQQFLFVQKSIKEDSGTPVAGWPEGKVILLSRHRVD